jgi:hypothetical protein
MTIGENKNFVSVSGYKTLDISDVLNTCHTAHLTKERQYRIDRAIELNKGKDGRQSKICKVFLVDKGHKDGKELHCVTEKGIIFILNEQKYLHNKNGFITIFFARPNQVKRLYEEIGESAPESIVKYCVMNQRNHINY